MSTDRILVLGAAGFLGSNLVARLLQDGCDVRACDLPGARPVTPLQAADGSWPRPGQLEQVSGNFMDAVYLRQVLEGCTLCYHLISTTLPQTANDHPVRDTQENLIGTLQLLDLARTSGLRRLVFVSSGGTVYGMPQHTPIDEDHPTEPNCVYGITKLAIEKHLALAERLQGLQSIVLRIANPYGESQRLQASQGVVAVFLGKVLRDEPIELWGDGSVIRDFVHIQDVVDALLAAGRYQGTGRVFNIGSGHGISLRELIGVIERTTGRSALIDRRPARPFDVKENRLSIALAAQELRWAPKISFSEGVARFADWLQTQALQPSSTPKADAAIKKTSPSSGRPNT